MKKCVLIVIVSAVLSCVSAQSQQQKSTANTIVNNCPYSSQHWNDLACLIPDISKTGGSTLGTFNTTLAQVLGQLPLAVPVSGFALSFDRSLGIYIVSSDNLGSVLTERGDTIGKHKVFIGFTFQRFVFHNIDGTSLNNFPTVYSANNGFFFGSAQNSIGANVNQYTPIVAFGLTNRIDISATLPFSRVSLSSSATNVQEAPLGCLNAGCVFAGPNAQAAGSASGPGDLLLNIKGTVWKGEKFRLALGSEFRFPTGDEFNLLGSGAYGIKPYLVFSRRGRITPHANVGYQWNGFSDLYVNPCYSNPKTPWCQPNTPSNPNPNNPKNVLPILRLPDDLEYSAGADVRIVKRLTVVTDLVGQLFFNAPRVTPAVPLTPSTVQNLPPAFTGKESVGIKLGNFNDDNLGVGVKVNPIGKLLISANVLIRLNTGGLRADYIPLVGVSYKF